MKQRIVQGLVQLADPETYAPGPVVKFMLPDLVKITGLQPAEIASRSQSVLTRILHEYDDFSVRTIDSFVSRIIRTFAHDLHLPVDFEIEMDRDVMLDEAADQMISKAGIDHDLTRLLIDFIEARTDDEKSWQIERDIKKTAGFLFLEGNQKFISKLHEIPAARILEMASEIRSAGRSFEARIVSLAQSAKKLITDHQIDNASFARGTYGIGGYFFKLAAGNLDAPNSYVTSTIRDNKWTAAKADPEQLAAIHAVKDRLTDIYHKVEDAMEKGFARYTLLGMIEKNIFQMGLLSAMEKEISTISREKRVLHISEFNKRITDIILQEPVPFIYERIGERYHNYLVDEFQDTSELQWKNLLPLIGDSLAYGRYNLVVGDGKQAIYRFRNGQVEQFMALPALPAHYEKEVFGEAERALQANYDPQVLKSNFRSLPAIIQFNNEFFSFASGQLSSEFQPIYHDHEQEISPAKKGGLVSVEFLPYNSKVEFDELNIKRVHELVAALSQKGFRKADIAILTRSNRDASIIARSLMSEGISVVSTEALLLAASPEVNFIITVLQYISDPQNLVAVAGIIHELVRKKKLSTSLGRHFPVQKGAWPSLDRILAEAGIAFNIKTLRGLTLYDLCEEIIRIFSLDEGHYNIYLQFFLDFAGKVSGRQGTHLADLLEAWEEKKSKLSVVVPEGIDAIRIMTIHKSKGLEFPVVIWPMATERLKTTFDQVWVELDKDIVPGLPVALLQTGSSMEGAGYQQQYQQERNSSVLDMINLIYVACTRPAERLYILTREPGKSDSNNLPKLLAQFIENNSGKWIQDGMVFSQGSDEHELIPSKQTEASGMLTDFISIPWQSRIKIARRAPVYWSSGQTKNRQAWGTLVHDTLASIQYRSEISAKVKLQANANLLSDADAELLLQRVTSTLDHPLLKEYFTEGSTMKSEAGILMPNGEVFRPDKVFFRQDETIIMEFKTGLPKPEHQKQLHHYGEILHKMGYPGIRKLLVYLDDEIKVNEL